ncbi:AC93-like protein [Orgyia pseudotsugata single capsid nuclopolyhedrovirus]|nr:AC93-like protein [Orgyia pseudotsugata single capsid nuclopolyhedrovirus]
MCLKAYSKKLSLYLVIKGVSGIMAEARTIVLYLCDMPAGIQNEKPIDENVLYFDGVVECLEDKTTSMYSLFAEMLRQKALLIKKMWCDLVEYNNGTYCKNHVLIDALVMYKTYVELVDESAFGNNIFEYCTELAANLFKVFRLQSKIVVVLSPDVNFEQDNLSAFLKHLLQLSIIEIVT